MIEQERENIYNEPKMTPTDCQMSVNSDYLKTCEEAARIGGAILLDWADRFNVQEKGPADLVTEADLASQRAIRETILAAFPDHQFLGEEADPEENDARVSEFRWIADPLDGTTNYVHRVPHFCVSLALERAGELVTAAVFDPISKECFTAIAGEGAWLNGQPIRTSDVDQLSDALAVVGFPPKVQPDAPDLRVFLAAINQVQAIRRTGSAALNMCYVAAGRFDVFWSFSTKVWDVAAGALIIRESGGVLTGPDGGDFVLNTGQFLAAAGESLHDQLHQLVRDARN